MCTGLQVILIIVKTPVKSSEIKAMFYPSLEDAEHIKEAACITSKLSRKQLGL